MPNWIEGTLKLRGPSENLKRFFREGLEPSQWLDEVRPLSDFVKCDFEDGYCEVEISDLPHIIGTRRAFITGNYVYWDGAYDTVAIEVKQAWRFDADSYVEISKKYGLDVRLYGFECGGEFSQEIEVIGGKLIYDNEITYENWKWECPMPNMGG